MDISAHLASCSGVWRAAAPASQADLLRLQASVTLDLPKAYLSFLAVSNGGEGDLAVEPGWVSFWPAAEVPGLNSSYSVGSFAPGLFGIGSNGGGELIALDTSAGVPYPVVMVPFVPLQRKLARLVAPNFDALVPLLGVNADAA